MGKIGCNIDTCTHNKENTCCYSGNLNIGLNSSVANNTTCCCSYDNMSDESFKSFAGPKVANTQCIGCNVEQCVHNENCMCGLDCIFVSGSSNATNESETKCTNYVES